MREVSEEFNNIYSSVLSISIVHENHYMHDQAVRQQGKLSAKSQGLSLNSDSGTYFLCDLEHHDITPWASVSSSAQWPYDATYSSRAAVTLNKLMHIRLWPESPRFCVYVHMHLLWSASCMCALLWSMRVCIHY